MSMRLPTLYKQSEIGLIPDEWNVQQLCEVAQIRGGIAKNSNVKISDPISVHYLRVANVQDGYLDLSEMSKIELSRHDLKRYAVLPGDVLMNEGGDLDQLGRGALWCGEFNPCVHQNHVFVVRCKSALLPNYLNVWTATNQARRFFLQVGKQTTNLASISKSSLGELLVAIPSLAEQKAIAGALSDADALIESLELLVAKKRHLKQGAMQELLAGKRRIPGFKEAWKSTSLGAVIEKFIGGGTPSRLNPRYWNGGIPWVTVKDFATFNPHHSQESITHAGLHHSASHLIPKGVLITSTRMALGKAVIYDVDVAINQDLKALFVRPSLDTQYLYFWFQHHEKFINELGSGSTVKGISLPDLKKIQLELPPRLEQVAIANVLSDMDTEVAELEVQLNKARSVKLGMMNNLLAGKIRLI